MTGAISSVSEKVLKDIPITSAAAAITGKLAGVNVVATDGSPDATTRLQCVAVVLLPRTIHRYILLTVSGE